MSGRDNFLAKFRKDMGRNKKLNSVDFMQIWTHYDKDSSGYLETKEFDMFLKDFIRQRGGKPTKEMVIDLRQAFLNYVDRNRDGRIELAEFANVLPVEQNFMAQFDTRSKLSRAQFTDIFYHYDPDGNGYVEGQELLALIRDIMGKAGKDVSMRELDEYKEAVLRVFDKNDDGRLSRQELGLLLSIDQ